MEDELEQPLAVQLFGSRVDLVFGFGVKYWNVVGAYVFGYQWIVLVGHGHSVRGRS